MRIAWKLKSLNATSASVRYRCLVPVRALEQRGHASVLLEGKEEIRDFSAIDRLVFAKSYSSHDLALAERARAHGMPVILDLCDNIFIDGYGNRHSGRDAGIFRDMAALAAAVVTTGPYLSEQVAAAAPTARIVEIPDPLERREDTEYFLDWERDPDDIRGQGTDQAMWIARRRLARLRKGARRMVDAVGGLPQLLRRRAAASAPGDGRKQIIWFGHNGGDHEKVGMLSLLAIADDIERAARSIPLRLLVVSNNRDKYEEHIKPLPFATAYREWGPLSVFDDIGASDLCLLPNPDDPVSLAKSTNRATLSLSLGVPVLASGIPAFQELRSVLILDDWQGGIETYLGDPERAARDVAMGQRLIDEQYRPEVHVERWIELFDSVG